MTVTTNRVGTEATDESRPPSTQHTVDYSATKGSPAGPPGVTPIRWETAPTVAPIDETGGYGAVVRQKQNDRRTTRRPHGMRRDCMWKTNREKSMQRTLCWQTNWGAYGAYLLVVERIEQTN